MTLILYYIQLYLSFINNWILSDFIYHEGSINNCMLLLNLVKHILYLKNTYL